ncbi:hypothetical protein N665_0186s0061 [Sinapis alba]|nr:hypothetical protein N665_0186s0061 [Sinapis alba]
MLRSTLGLEWRRRLEFLYLTRHCFRYLQTASHDPYHSDSDSQPMPACEMNLWSLRFSAFLISKHEQEIVSENLDGFQKISGIASRMGLYSRQYDKAVVFSKVPLPRYRRDLDDRCLRREVVLPVSVEREVDAYLEDIFDERQDGFLGIPKPSRNEYLATGNGHSQKSASPLPEAKSFQLKSMQQNWLNSPQGQEMFEFRKSLPAYKERDVILKLISENQVVVVSGETGCGKTTQLPQYILESEIESSRGASCSIICTQPRKISAISVSERVAAERGEKSGENVGYKIRNEGILGKDTRLLFCTSGILLRRLQSDRSLEGVSHVIIDEIHERGMNEDFLLVVLKDILPRRPDLRLILMSATLNAELFSSYFDGAQTMHIPGFTYPIRTHFLEDILENTFKTAESKRNTWIPDCIDFDLIQHVLCHIVKGETPGAVLVFMTGWEDINYLKSNLQAHPLLGDPSRVLLLTCHGSMENSKQKLIFDRPPDGIRKIVVATNIAETSITINDVVFVVDCGKAKESSYDALNNTPCLLPSWISKASARQRRGRAGRVMPGECYHLYPKQVYDALDDYQRPELLRSPLQSLCLQIKSLRLGKISEFLSKALQSPEPLSVQNAVEDLKTIGALDDNENLTVLGEYLSTLPVEPKLGKMLVLGSIFSCLDPILTVVAGLDVKDPFIPQLDKNNVKKLYFSSGNYSDHLTLVRAYDGWKEAQKEGSGQAFCRMNHLSLQRLKDIDSMRKQFLCLLKNASLVSNVKECNKLSHDEHLVRAIICAGLFPGVSSVVNHTKEVSLETMDEKQARLSSNSVNGVDRLTTRIPYPWLVFNQKVKVKVHSVFLRDSTGVSDSALLLFGGNLSPGSSDGHLTMSGGFFEFFMRPPSLADTYLSLKTELDQLIQTKLQNPRRDNKLDDKLISAIRLLLSKDKCEGRFVSNVMF